MSSARIRVAGALMGNLQRQTDARIKYGSFFEALGRRFDLAEIYDAGLAGPARYLNALQTFSPSISHWKEHFFKNETGFIWRSRQAARHFNPSSAKLDVILQLGALFDVASYSRKTPVVLYTDNTTRITARHPHLYRFPFSPAELQKWLKLEKLLYENTAFICTRARIVKKSLIEDYSVPPEKILVVGGGVNFPAMPKTLPIKAGNDFSLLFIGTDFYRKGGDLILEAFALARHIHPQIKLTLVTQDQIPDGLPVNGVTVYAPIWDRSKLETLYRQADGFILASRMETWGDVILEAMSFGLPCIGVYGQAMEDMIVHQETGLLVDPENPELLAHAIIKLVEQPDLRHRMGQAAARLVSRDFTWDRVVERLAPILSNVVSKDFLSTNYSSLERKPI